ncbi:hypothetical protein Z946_3034 [Sulfitobacter noctilucicola]|uniref:Dihydrodipicolinate reductase n=1 Tax=Sulfitobacter noctilucicola TaxID=1342301 RepID=A0A7W6MAW9_9RHOB|nr:hypothetical protein [Sulfitobacter noctilucicola]KIN64147.1 hypothetical protein Z946_3034 [Sulfitobacter noctilucicola]MBB4175501.1 hypothetical protein [Sulfitobacter noctilucicola]
MMRVGMMILLVLPAFQATADGVQWTALDGPAIASALTDTIIDYEDKWQDFRASGRTLYFSGHESWGYWEVRQDRYCSMWPPSDLWTCYDIQQSGKRLRFIDNSGDMTEGVFRVTN